MAEIGRADLVIVPRFDGLSASINRALGSADMTSGGTKMGTSLGVSMAGAMSKSVVAGNLIAGAIEKVIGFVSDKMGDAVGRLDTMENYKLVMENLGYGADSAEASIQKMSDRLQNLPTTLDAMAGTVQGLSVITGDLDKATDAGLALNDMLLASGSNTELVSAAGEQFRQMLAKGKPEMQDWKSLMQAAPAQMQALAKEMLGAEATTNDLYEALGGGGHAASVSMDELLDAMVRLDTEGGGGLASFRQQAETAQGGIETAMANMGNAVTKGLANVMDAIGRDNITGAFNAVRDGITGAFNGIAAGVQRVKDNYTVLNEYVDPSNSRINTAIQSIVSDLGEIPGAADLAAQSFDWLNQRAAADYEKASRAQVDYYERRQQHAAQSEKIAAAYQEESSRLAYAQGVIEKYANSTSLSSAEQANFARAIETVNELCGTNYQVVDASAGAFANEAGEIQNNTEAIKDNIEQRRNLAKSDTFGQEYAETEKDYAKAVDTMGKWQTTLDGASAAMEEVYDKYQTKDIGKIYHDIAKEMRESSDPEVREQADEFRKTTDRYLESVHGLSSASKDVHEHAKSMEELAFAQSVMALKGDEAAMSLDELAGRSAIVQEAFMGEGSKASLSMAEFAETIGKCTTESDRMKEVLNDPNMLSGMIQAYDGTAESLRGFFESAGLGWNDVAAKEIDAQNRTENLRASLEGMRTGLETLSVSDMGLNFDQFTEQLANANVSAETLSTMGLPALSDAMQQSGGQMDALIAIINAWNQAPMYDKNGKVDVTGISTLRDSQQRVYTWNGTELRDQDGKVVMDTVELHDAQGKVYVWNDSELKELKGSATVASDSVQTGIDRRDNWNAEGLASYTASGVINITRSITDVFHSITGTGSAIGGFRPHADGGIARKAVPLDIVGEDGAEAIVPLTNKKYAMPFVNMIADEINKDRTGGTVNIYVSGAADPEVWGRKAMRAARQLATAEGR